MKEIITSVSHVMEFLEISALKYPCKTAVRDQNRSVTYQELLRDAEKIGSGLLGKVKRNCPVPIFMEKSVAALEAFFGVLSAGGFYVLINPELPKPRIEQILQVLNVDFIIACRRDGNLIPDLPQIKTVYYIEDLQNSEIDAVRLKTIRQNSIDTDPLYANFTSGSTGVPKGVVVSHRSVIDFINVFTGLFDITCDDVIANQAPFDFDVSVKDIYSAMKTGATLEIIPRELFSAPTRLADYLFEREITVMIWAVSALCLMTSFHVLDYKAPPHLKKILFSGEIMPLKHLKQWIAHYPDASFVNLYGPTEITCNCTYYRILQQLDDNPLPIGIPFPNERVFLLDADNNVIETVDCKGEICVSGTALALGYYNNEEETQKRFVQNPLNTRYLEPIYRTGDLGYYNADNQICFAGRKDFQVKYLGHRIELEEIDRAASGLEGIERACCIFPEKKNHLILCYVGTADSKEIHHQLSRVLPVYMVPGIYRCLDSMPLTPNGKIDRKALQALYGEAVQKCRKE